MTDNINDSDTQNDPSNAARKENRVLKYTETIDKLVLQNKQLQKELIESDSTIESLNHRLEESNVRISKNLFYIGIIIIGYFVYSGNNHLTAVQNQLVEMNVILKEYKSEIHKTKLYNELLEKKLNIAPQTINPEENK